MECSPPRVDFEWSPPRVDFEWSPPRVDFECSPPRVDFEWSPPFKNDARATLGKSPIVFYKKLQLGIYGPDSFVVLKRLNEKIAEEMRRQKGQIHCIPYMLVKH